MSLHMNPNRVSNHPHKRVEACGVQLSEANLLTTPKLRSSQMQRVTSLLWATTIACLMVLVPSIGVASESHSGYSSPQLNIILPRGVQRGQEQVLNFHGERLSDVVEVMFYEPAGFEVKNIEVVNDKHVKATIMISPECRLGEHVAQLRATSGISEFLTFQVEAYPAIDEAEPNGSLEEAQPVSLNYIVAGVVESEDVDYFVVDAKQGQRISAEVFAVRLGDTLFDPYVSILDSKRFELDADDDTPLARQDAVASIVAPEDGKYYIAIRESSYGGNGNCRYRLAVGNFPRPTAVYPAGGKFGETIEVTYFGDATGEMKAQVTVPTEPLRDFGLFPEDENGIAASSIPFRPSPFGNTLEVEPNNSFGEATTAEPGTAFNGRISEPGDIDCFRFTAKKGESFDVECFARRLRTGLDPVVAIYGPDSKAVVSNDDSRGPDSYMRFSAPVDGEYILRVWDHLMRGQEDFVYRVELLPVQPSLTLSIPRVARYSQYRQSIFIPRGNRFATLITASRANFGGEIVLDDSQLPEGVTMYAPPMRDNLNSMPVVFEAAEDAPLSGKVIRWEGRHVDSNTGISGPYTNSVDLVRGPPNNAVFYPLDVDKIAFAVVDKLPFQLEIVQPQAPLVRDGTMDLKVVVHRAEGFNEPINVEFPFRPPGVGAGSAITIPADQSEAIYQLSANANAQLGEWPIYVIGSANVNGAAWVASQLATLEVAEPFVRFDVARASCEQGQPAQILCTLNHIGEFEGEATVSIVGVPPNIGIEPMKFTKDTEELVFNVTTSDQSPVGKHKNLIARVTITHNGEPVVSNAGVGELQIDKPIPKETTPAPEEKKAEPQPKPEEKKAEPPAKPLTRLEKLRLEAKKRRAQDQDDDQSQDDG